jgi:excisionase family DNA binding protein
MHIAHHQSSGFISVEELAKRVGLKRRQIAELARNGKIPGATRLDGYHYVYPITSELLEWIEWKRRRVKQRQRPVKTAHPKLASGVITIQGIRMEFDLWLRRVGGLDGILKMESEVLQDLVVEIQPIARLHWRINQELRQRDST